MGSSDQASQRAAARGPRRRSANQLPISPRAVRPPQRKNHGIWLKDICLLPSAEPSSPSSHTTADAQATVLARKGLRNPVGRRPSLRGDVLREVAGDLVTGPKFPQRGRFGAAHLLRLPAPGVEPAGRRRVEGARHVADKADALAALALPLGATLG